MILLHLCCFLLLKMITMVRLNKYNVNCSITIMCTIGDFDSINATAITSLTVVSTSNTAVAVCSPLTSNITVTSGKTGTVNDMHMNEKGKSSPCGATHFVCCTSRWNCS